MSNTVDVGQSTNYNNLVDEYVDIEISEMRVLVEEFTVLSILGDVRAKAVLDLACGLGKYSRAVKRQGAATVVGVDISEGMIAQAKSVEAREPLGIKYLVQDIITLKQVGSFDAVTAAYLFPYAQTRQTLEAMADATFINLKPQGRLVFVIPNPIITEQHLAAARKHGVLVRVTEPISDGDPMDIILCYANQKEEIQLINYYWSKETYEDVLRKVGFKEISWHPMRVSEEGIKKYGWAYWQDYLATPQSVVVECCK